MVENLEEKRNAFAEGLEKVEKCKAVLGKNASINFVAGRVDDPVMTVRLDGLIEVHQLLTMYKILKDS